MSHSRFRLAPLGILLPALLAAQVGVAQSSVDPAALRALKQRQSAADPALAALATTDAAEREAMGSLLGVEPDARMITLDLAGANPDGMAAALTALGAQNVSRSGNAISARVPVAQLDALLAMPGLRVARPVRAVLDAGVVTSQGDPAMRSDLARAGLASVASGQGVRVGVLSDSFGCEPGPALAGAPTSTVAQAMTNGDLPTDYTILDDSICADPESSPTDEGRGMAELIYDVAPQTSGAFHTAFGGQADFANGILELADAGSDVIVDDVIYFEEPMFQDGLIAQAAATVVTRGVPYFASAGNRVRRSYEAPFRPVQLGAGFVAHDFDPGPGIDLFQSIALTANGRGLATFQPSFQWDEPFFSVSGGAGSASDVDMLYFDANGNLLPDCIADADPVRFPDTMGTPPLCQMGSTVNTGGDAVEVPEVQSLMGSVTVNAMFVLAGGPAPTRVKYIVFSQGFTIAEFDTQSGTSYGHNNATGVMSIGAAPFDTTTAFGDPRFAGACLPACAENFSSAGGIEILFDAKGNRLPAPENRMNPDVTGPDGANTSFFSRDSAIDDDDGDGLPTSGGATGDAPGDEFPNFFGTSAAAPHVAAVAALMLDGSESLAIVSNDGSQQRVCLAGQFSLLLSKAQAAVLLGMPAIARAGFCLTPAAIETALESTALDMTRRAAGGGTTLLIPNSVGVDPDTGAGFVDAEAAIRSVTPAD